MLIWLASYPRSGNTLLRHAIERLYGLKTWSVYHDYANQSLLPGWRRWPVDAQDRQQDVDFVKTHGVEEATDPEPAIHLVRDGRDAIVSQAHLMKARGELGVPLHDIMRMLIDGSAGWNWSKHSLSWIENPNTQVVRFDELAADPLSITNGAVSKLLALPVVDGASVDSFESMQTANPEFFRSGKSGGWREHMDDELHELFWLHHGAAMNQLGYLRGLACPLNSTSAAAV